MSTTTQIIVDTLIGAAAGAVGGMIAGWWGAFLEAYLLHPLARVTDAQGRVPIARANAPAGGRLGAVIGFVVGGVAGGTASLTVALVIAAAFSVAAIILFRRASGEPLIGPTWACIAGAFSAAFIGYAIEALVGAM